MRRRPLAGAASAGPPTRSKPCRPRSVRPGMLKPLQMSVAFYVFAAHERQAGRWLPDAAALRPVDASVRHPARPGFRNDGQAGSAPGRSRFVLLARDGSSPGRSHRHHLSRSRAGFPLGQRVALPRQKGDDRLSMGRGCHNWTGRIMSAARSVRNPVRHVSRRPKPLPSMSKRYHGHGLSRAGYSDAHGNAAACFPGHKEADTHRPKSADWSSCCPVFSEARRWSGEASSGMVLIQLCLGNERPPDRAA